MTRAPTEPSEEAALRAEIKRVCWGRFVSESEFDQLLDRFRAAAPTEPSEEALEAAAELCEAWRQCEEWGQLKPSIAIALDRFRAAGVRRAAPRDGLTPRLRALSITNQHASLFTSVGAREQVAESIEKHITAAPDAEPGR